MEIQAAYMSRISNKENIERANSILYGDKIANRYIIASKQIKHRAMTLLGHMLRDENENDHTKRVTLNKDLNRVEKEYKRVGKP